MRLRSNSQRSKDRDNFVEIEAKNAIIARARMFELYDDKWGFQYDEEGFEGQPEKYGLTRIGEVIIVDEGE